MSAVASDASPLHYLIKCGAVTTLEKMFGDVIIPPAVYSELQHKRTPTVVRDWISSRPDWLSVQGPRVIE